MRPRSLAILAAVVVALGAFLWFVERDLPGSEERAERGRLLLPELDGEARDEVTAVVVESGGERVRLVREAAAEGGGDDETDEGDDAIAADLLAAEEPRLAGWRFAEPAAYAGRRADAQAVADLLSALAGVARERHLESVDPAAVGLDAPRARVRLEGLAGGEALELTVGGEVPASHQMVVAVAGRDGAFLVDRGLHDELSRRRAGDWRARDLLPAAGREAVTRLRVEGAAGPVVLVRDGERFVVTLPAGEGRGEGAAAGADVADAEAVDELLAALTGLTAVRFVDEPEPAADLGLEPPRGAVEAALAGGETFRVEVGGETDAGTVHLRLGDQVVTARTQLAAVLDRPAAAWPSRRLSELRPFEVARLAVRGEQGSYVLAREGGEWRRDGVRIPYSPVSDLLYAIADARAEEVLPRAALRLRAPTLSVELGAEAAPAAGGEEDAGEEDEDEGDERDKGDEGEAAMRRGAFHLHGAAGADGRVAATVDGRDRVLLLDAATAMNLRDKIAAVSAAEPLPDEDDDGLPDGVEVEVEEGDGETP